MFIYVRHSVQSTVSRLEAAAELTLCGDAVTLRHQPPSLLKRLRAGPEHQLLLQLLLRSSRWHMVTSSSISTSCHIIQDVCALKEAANSVKVQDHCQVR